MLRVNFDSVDPGLPSVTDRKKERGGDIIGGSTGGQTPRTGSWGALPSETPLGAGVHVSLKSLRPHTGCEWGSLFRICEFGCHVPIAPFQLDDPRRVTERHGEGPALCQAGSVAGCPPPSCQLRGVLVCAPMQHPPPRPPPPEAAEAGGAAAWESVSSYSLAGTSKARS